MSRTHAHLVPFQYKKKKPASPGRVSKLPVLPSPSSRTAALAMLKR